MAVTLATNGGGFLIKRAVCPTLGFVTVDPG